MRAWGLLQGLKHAGLRVTYAAPERVAWVGWDQNCLPDFEVVLFRSASDLTEAIRNNNPDAVVVVNWEFLEWLPEDLHIPIVVDLIAPRLLEIQFQEGLRHGVSTEMLRYVDALSRGDRFLCSTERQKAFYYSWLMMGGIDCREGIIDVVPISAAPPKKAAGDRDSEMTFVYGGVSWPWQKPSRFLNQLLAVLEENKKGQLLLMSGAYPLAEVEEEELDLGSQLKSSTHLKKQGLIPYDEMERVFRNAHLAVDLAEQSPERELSFSYRIIEYLRCGLPVICNHYLAIADRISRYQAGWLLDTEKEEGAFKSLVEELLRKPELVSERSDNALRLVREEFNWEKTAAPLVRFCKNPKPAERREHLLKTLVTRSKVFEQQLSDHRDKLGSLDSQSSDLNQQLDALRSSYYDGLDSLTRQLHQAEKGSQAQFKALDEGIGRIENTQGPALSQSVQYVHHRLDEMSRVQERIEHRLLHKGLGGFLRWLIEFPERIFRVLFKPLFTRWKTQNIAIITRADLFPAHHGAAVRILEIAKSLSFQCEKVFVITADRIKYLVFEKGEMYGLLYPKLLARFPFGTTRLAQWVLRRRGVPHRECFLWFALYDLNHWLRTLFIAYQYGISLYQAEFPGYLRPALIARSLFGGKASLVEHNIEFLRIAATDDLKPGTQEFLKRVETRLCKQADYVVTMSDIDKQRLVDAGVSEDHITTIPHGVDLGRFKDVDPKPLRKLYKLNSSRPVLVYHGIYSYAPNKAAAEALGKVILPGLERKGHRVIFLAIGPDPFSESPHPALRFLGGVDDIASHLALCDLAVVPLMAGGGTRMKLLDYFAARIPVICTRKAAEGLSLEEGVHAVLVDSVEEMIDPIIDLIENPERAEEMAAHAYRMVQDYDWQAIGKRTMQLYQLPWWVPESRQS